MAHSTKAHRYSVPYASIPFAVLLIVVGSLLYAQGSGGSPLAGKAQRTYYAWQWTVLPTVCSMDSSMQKDMFRQKKEHGRWVKEKSGGNVEVWECAAGRRAWEWVSVQWMCSCASLDRLAFMCHCGVYRPIVYINQKNTIEIINQTIFWYYRYARHRWVDN